MFGAVGCEREKPLRATRDSTVEERVELIVGGEREFLEKVEEGILTLLDVDEEKIIEMLEEARS